MSTAEETGSLIGMWSARLLPPVVGFQHATPFSRASLSARFGPLARPSLVSISALGIRLQVNAS
jgi:hypothetical protein